MASPADIAAAQRLLDELHNNRALRSFLAQPGAAGGAGPAAGAAQEVGPNAFRNRPPGGRDSDGDEGGPGRGAGADVARAGAEGEDADPDADPGPDLGAGGLDGINAVGSGGIKLLDWQGKLCEILVYPKNDVHRLRQKLSYALRMAQQNVLARSTIIPLELQRLLDGARSSAQLQEAVRAFVLEFVQPLFRTCTNCNARRLVRQNPVPPANRFTCGHACCVFPVRSCKPGGWDEAEDWDHLFPSILREAATAAQPASVQRRRGREDEDDAPPAELPGQGSGGVGARQGSAASGGAGGSGGQDLAPWLSGSRPESNVSAFSLGMSQGYGPGDDVEGDGMDGAEGGAGAVYGGYGQAGGGGGGGSGSRSGRDSYSGKPNIVRRIMTPEGPIYVPGFEDEPLPPRRVAPAAHATYPPGLVIRPNVDGMGVYGTGAHGARHAGVVQLPDGNLLIPIDQAGADRGDGDPYRAAARMAVPQLVRLGPGGPTAMAMGPTHQHQHQHVRDVLDVGLLPDDGRLGMHGAQQLPQIQIQHQIQQQQQQLQLLRQLQQQLQLRLSQDAGVQQARALAGLPPGTRIVRLPDGQLAAALGPVGDGEDLPGPGLAHRHSEERHADLQGAPGPLATTTKPRLQPVQSFPMPTAFAYPPESAFRQQPPPQPTQPPTAQRKQAQQPRSKPPVAPQDEEDEEYEIITLPDGRKARILPDKPEAPRAAAAAAAAGSGRDGSTAHEGRLAAGEDDGEEVGGGGGQDAAAEAAAEAEDGGDDGPTWHHRSTRPAGRGGRAGGSGGGGSQLNMVPSTSTVLSPTPGATTTITAGATALTAATEVSPAPPPPLPQPRVVRLPDGRVFLLDPLPQDAAADAAAATGDDGDGDGGDADGSGGGQEGGVRRGSGSGPRSPPLPPPPRPLGRATPAGSEGSLGSGERPAAAATAVAAKGGATTSTTSSGSRLATAVLGMVPVATVGAPDGSNCRTVVVRRLLLQPLSFSPEEIGVDPGELPLVHMGPVVELQPAAGRAAAAAAAAAAAMVDAAVDEADDDDGGGGDGDVITSARDLPPEPPPPRRAVNAQAQVQQPDRQVQQPDRQAQQQQLIEQLLMKPLRSEGTAPPGVRPHAAAAANAAAAASAAARAANAAARAAAEDAAGDDDVVMLDPQDPVATASAAYRDALQRAQRQQLQQLQLQQLQQLQQQQQQAALVQQAQLLLLQQQRDRERQLATARQQQQQQQQQQLQRALRQQQQAALAAAQQVQQAAASMHAGPGTGAGTDRSGHGLSHAHSAVHRRSSRDAVPQLPLLTEEELAQAAPEDWQAYIGSLLEVAALQLPQDLPYDAVPRPAYGVRPGFLLRAMQFDPPGARPWSTRLVLRGARSVAAAGPAAVAGLFSSAVYDSDLITLCCDVPTDIVQTGVKLPAAIAVTDLRPRKELPVTGLQGSPLLMWPSPEAHAPQLAAFSRLGLARIALVARLDERCDLVICPQEMSGVLLVVGAVIRRTNGGGGGQVQGRSGAKSAAALAAPALPPELPSVPTLDGSGGSVNSGPSAGRKRPAEAQPGPAAARGAPTARVETPNLADLATAAGKAAAAATATTTASMYSTARFQPPQNPISNVAREQKDGAGAGPATAGVGARGAGAGAGALASGSYAVPLVAPLEPTRPPAAVATTQRSEPGAGAGKKPTGSAGAAGPTPGPAGSKRPPGYNDALGLLMALASTMAQGGKRASGGPGPGPGPTGAQKGPAGPPKAAAPSDPRRPPPPPGPAAEARPQAGDGPGAAPRPAATLERRGQADGAEAEADAGPKAVDANMEAAPAAEAEAGQAVPNPDPDPNPSPNAIPDPDPEVQGMEAEGAETAAGAEAEEGQAPAAADPEADADVAIDLAEDPDPGADPETETDPDIETAEVEMTGPAEAEPEATEGQGLAGSPPAAGPAEHPEAEAAEDAAGAEAAEAEAAAAGHPAEAEAPEAADPMQIDGADGRVEDEEEEVDWSDLDVQIVRPGADRAAWDGPDRGPAGDAEVAERERDPDPDPDPAAAQAPQPPGPPGPAADAVADEAAAAAPQDEAVAAAAAADAEVGQEQGPGPAEEEEEEEGAKAGRAGAPAGSPDGLWDDDEGFV